MARITLFSYDRTIDRRALLQAESLRARGHEVTLYAQACEGTSNDPDYVKRVGASVAGVVKESSTPRVFCWRQRLEQTMPSLFRVMLPHLRLGYWLMNGCKPENLYLALYAETLSTLAPAYVYIAHDLPMLPVALRAREQLGGKVIYDSHEFFCEQEFSFIEKRMWRRLETAIISKADAVITVNPSIARELKTRYHLPAVEVIYNAEKQPDPPLRNQRLFHHALSLPDEARIVLYQGGLSFGRNIDALVKAAAYLAPELHVVVLGSGPARYSLEVVAKQAGINQRVHFIDAVPQAELLGYTASADLGIIPYQDTCLNYRFCTPNKLFEFIAGSVPVVASDLPEIARMLYEQGNGLVGNTADPKALAALISEALTPTTYANLKAHAESARSRVCWQHEGERFANIVEAVIP